MVKHESSNATETVFVTQLAFEEFRDFMIHAEEDRYFERVFRELGHFRRATFNIPVGEA